MKTKSDPKIRFDTKIKSDPKIRFYTKIKSGPKIRFHTKFVYIQNSELILDILEHSKPSISSLKLPGSLLFGKEIHCGGRKSRRNRKLVEIICAVSRGDYSCINLFNVEPTGFMADLTDKETD